MVFTYRNAYMCVQGKHYLSDKDSSENVENAKRTKHMNLEVLSKVCIANI